MEHACTVFAFTNLHLEINRIETEVVPGNIYSEKALKRPGFINEGILRDWLYWNDNNYNIDLFHPSGILTRKIQIRKNLRQNKIKKTMNLYNPLRYD